MHARRLAAIAIARARIALASPGRGVRGLKVRRGVRGLKVRARVLVRNLELMIMLRTAGTTSESIATRERTRSIESS
jgi:hypothetical protein